MMSQPGGDHDDLPAGVDSHADTEFDPGTDSDSDVDTDTDTDTGIDVMVAPERAGAIDAETVRALEAVILVATEPVPPAQLAELLEIPVVAVERLCERLAETYEEAGHGFQLARVAGGYRYQSHPEVAAYVERYVLDGQRARLSAAALETLAIVAYKQPISRAQIASIRGVDPDGVLRTLVARGYVDQIARDPGPGQAALYGTTVSFLDKLGLDSLDDLPAIAEFLPGADVVEALEQGLRVTPVETASPGDRTPNSTVDPAFATEAPRGAPVDEDG